MRPRRKREEKEKPRDPVLARIDAKIDEIWLKKWSVEDQFAFKHRLSTVKWVRRKACDIPDGIWGYTGAADPVGEGTGNKSVDSSQTILKDVEGREFAVPADRELLTLEKRLQLPCECDTCESSRERNEFLKARDAALV